MSSVVKATGPEHFLSLVPSMLGYTPTRSAVMVPFAGSRSLGALRIDLPPSGEVEAVAATLIGMACRVDAADGLAVIVYDGATEEHDPDAVLPHRPLVDAVAARAHACGLRLVDALYVGPDRWGSYRARDVGGATAALSARGDGIGLVPEPVGDQRTGAALPDVGRAVRESVGFAVRELDRAIRAVTADHDDQPADLRHRTRDRIDPTALAALALLDDVPAFFDGLVPPSGTGSASAPADAPQPATGRVPRDPYATAALIWCLSRPALRDIGLITWTDGIADGDQAFDDQLRWEAGEEYPGERAERMWGEGPVPDVARLTAALSACREAASAAPSALRPGALSACAWLAWALGRQTHAAEYAGQALDIDPAHGLSEIVLTFVRIGHLPDWAFRR